MKFKCDLEMNSDDIADGSLLRISFYYKHQKCNYIMDAYYDYIFLIWNRLKLRQLLQYDSKYIQFS